MLMVKMSRKPRDTVGEFGVGRLFPEMAPRQPGPTSGLKVHFTNDRGRCDRSAEFANSVRWFLDDRRQPRTHPHTAGLTHEPASGSPDLLPGVLPPCVWQLQRRARTSWGGYE